MRTCSAMPQAISWQAMATTPVQSRIILGIATSNTPSATPNFRPRASRISGAIRSCLGKTNAAAGGERTAEASQTNPDRGEADFGRLLGDRTGSARFVISGGRPQAPPIASATILLHPPAHSQKGHGL